MSTSPRSPCWEGHPDAARVLVEEGLGIVANQDESLATGYLCAVGLRAEADRADESRVRQRIDERDEAIGKGSELLEVMRGVLSRPGPDDGWKREVGAFGAQCEAEGDPVVRGIGARQAWGRAVDAWEALSMPYAAAYCRWRHAEALLGTVGPGIEAQEVLGCGARHGRTARRRSPDGSDPSSWLAARGSTSVQSRSRFRSRRSQRSRPESMKCWSSSRPGAAITRSRRHCSSATRPPACTFRTSCGSSRSRRAAKRPRWRTAVDSCAEVHRRVIDRSFEPPRASPEFMPTPP